MNPVDPVSYKPALTVAYNALQHTNAKIKHIVLLGDAEDSYTALATQIHKPGITIWTVVTGAGPMASGPTTARCRTSRAGAAGALPRRKPRCAATRGAQHRCPHGSVVDGSGNLCITDADNQRVRDVTTSGPCPLSPTP
jgi:hypothetical protein